MQPRSDIIVPTSTLSPTGAGSLARPHLPQTTTLSADGMRAIDLEEQMDPLAVAESTADASQSLAVLVWQFVVIGIAAAAIWWLLPRGVTPRPPLELPAALQGESGSVTPAQQAAEDEAIALLKRAVPTQALAAFRRCIDSGEPASVNAWRYYLQTLVDLDERAELRQRAAQFLAQHPDRLEAAHFLAEALRRDNVEAHRQRDGVWGSRIDPAYVAEIDRCQNTISDALNLLQQHDGEWSAAKRTAWTDLLHLDRAHLHHQAWKCGGLTFADPHREQALEAIRQLSTATSADALALRIAIYHTCVDAWPKPMFGGTTNQFVNGRERSLDDLRLALSQDRETLARLPPTGRR